MYIFIFYIAHARSYRKLREIFGLSKSTIFDIIDTYATIFSNLAYTEITFPQPVEFDELKRGFERRAQFYGTILIIDGTHIPIKRPRNSNFAYYNRKGFFFHKYALFDRSSSSISSHDIWIWLIS